MDEDTEATRSKAARQKAGEIIKQIEASRVQTYHTPGNHLSPLSQVPVVLPLTGENNDMPQQLFNYNVSPPGAITTSASTAIDDNYIIMGGHLDQAIQDKIKKGEYVDFARLLPQDRVVQDDHRMELINKGGQTYFVSIIDRDSAGVIKFHKMGTSFSGLFKSLPEI